MIPYKVNELLSVPARPFKVMFSRGRIEREGNGLPPVFE